MITKEELIQVVLGILTKEQMLVLNQKLEEIHRSHSAVQPQPVRPIEVVQTRKRVVNDDFSVNRDEDEDMRSSVPVYAGENTWQDEGEEKDGFDQKIKRKHTPRIRPKVVMQTMVCSVCQKAQEVPPGLLRKGAYYRCENCVGGGR